jgi:hypothetical protein
MSPSIASLGETVWDLPPLILHPFNERVPPSSLVENSKAALMLAGLIPPDGSDQDELRKRLMAGRYSEVRMLYYLGKDVFRWVEQCMEIAERTPELKDAEVRAQSFVGMLSGGPPESVKEKLIRWGVVDYTSIFSRCVGLNSLFAEPPQITGLTEEFLRNYHRYSDALYRCYMDLEPHRIIVAHNFRFELYASSEYSRMLESEWEAE